MNQQSNAIYMVAIDHGKSNWKHSNFAQYSRKSWERWCEKNGVDFFCVTEHDDRYGYPIWNKLNVIDVCKEYDKIGIVDCDTMININAPNIFDTLEDGVSGVLDDSNYNWIYHSVKNYGVYFSDELDYEKYINAGVVFLDNDSLRRSLEILPELIASQSEFIASSISSGIRIKSTPASARESAQPRPRPLLEAQTIAFLPFMPKSNFHSPSLSKQKNLKPSFYFKHFFENYRHIYLCV